MHLSRPQQSLVDQWLSLIAYGIAHTPLGRSGTATTEGVAVERGDLVDLVDLFRGLGGEWVIQHKISSLAVYTEGKATNIPHHGSTPFLCRSSFLLPLCNF